MLSLWQDVLIAEPGIRGILTAIRISASVDYEVTWWSGGDKISAWFAERELSAGNRKQLGFTGEGTVEEELKKVPIVMIPFDDEEDSDFDDDSDWGDDEDSNIDDDDDDSLFGDDEEFTCPHCGVPL